MTLLRVLCVLHILSGMAGVVAGEESAAGGWWLIVVFSVLLLLTFLGTARKRNVISDRPRSRPA